MLIRACSHVVRARICGANNLCDIGDAVARLHVTARVAGVAVGAMIESGNQGGSPQIRERYRGYGYAVFVPVGAVVGGVVGGIIGARKH
jgi:hypothetical protein